jgi:radical SAM superfamily enzyme YgiQ (UPF0313 family)
MIFLSIKRSLKAEKGYRGGLVDQFLDKVKDSDLIGIGLMTNTYYQARELTEAIRRANIKTPIIWGGVHPTVAPDSCIDTADMLCVGEGEWPMVDLADAMQRNTDYTTIPNLWVRRNGQVIKNDVRPLFENLDELPFPDYQIEQNHFVAHKGQIVPARPGNLHGTLLRYRLLTTRGCPYNCAFCCNSVWIKLYKGKGHWVRKRSVPNIIAELEQIKNRFPTVNSIGITDDTFFIREEEEFEQFAKLYNERIGFPFDAYTHPASLSRRKLDILQGCGCALIKMGIQSGSQDTNYTIFNRRVPNETVINAMRLLEEFPTITKEYHYIVDNPFEPEKNVKETLHFAAENHRGRYRVEIFPLALFPGSALYYRAKQEGILKDEQEQVQIYERAYTGKAKRRFDLLGYQVMLLRVVVYLRSHWVPSKVLHRFIDFMLARPVRFCLDRRWFKLSAVWVYLVGRHIRKTLYQIFVRPFRKYRRRYMLERMPPSAH